MAIRAINPDAVRQYVSARDPDYANWRPGSANAATVFSLRALSAGELFEILDSTQEIVATEGSRPGIHVNLNRRNWRLVETGLVGWHNFTDERGNPMSFEFAADGASRPRPSRRCLDALPAWLIRELAHEILRDNSLTEAEAKNSAASLEERSAPPSEAAPKSGPC